MWSHNCMTQSPPAPDPQLLHLITLMACSVDFRNKVLDSVAIYLRQAAKQREATIDEITADQERYVLGSMYCLLAGVHDAYLLDGLSHRQANARAGHWFSERLAEFLEA